MTTDRVHVAEDLAPFDLLSTPVWIVDLDRAVQWWANLACLPMWGVASREELLARSARSKTSEASRTRLAALRRRFERGERSLDVWTLYPDDGDPFVMECRSSGIVVADRRGEPGRLALLIEGRRLGREEVDPGERRGIEALRYLGELVSLYTEAGAGLMRNPAGVRALGDPGEGDQFAAVFVSTEQAAQARRCLAAGEIFRADVRARTTAGERWYDTEARRSLDPLTGRPAILMTQRDVTEQRAHLEELERSRQQLSAQAEALRRLAAPVIRVRAGVLVLPLIGALDGDRVDAMLEILMERVDRERVRRVVLDLTGSAALDETAAEGLRRVVRVLQLRGVAPALSGIRPGLAQTIADAGLDLAGVPCFQSVEHALGA